MIGATRTLTGTPAAATVRIASKRALGEGAYGSIARAMRSSPNGMEKCTWTRPNAASSQSRSRSRWMSTLLVTIPTGLPNSRQTSSIPRVSRYDASSGW
jgi:hypothetical protein